MRPWPFDPLSIPHQSISHDHRVYQTWLLWVQSFLTFYLFYFICSCCDVSTWYFYEYVDIDWIWIDIVWKDRLSYQRTSNDRRSTIISRCTRWGRKPGIRFSEHDLWIIVHQSGLSIHCGNEKESRGATENSGPEIGEQKGEWAESAGLKMQDQMTQGGKCRNKNAEAETWAPTLGEWLRYVIIL